MATQSHNTKKPTKKQMLDMIPKVVEQDLKKNYVKNMCQGRELALNEILNKINDGKSIEEIKEYIEKCIKTKETFEQVAMNDSESK